MAASRGKRAFAQLYNFEGFSFREISIDKTVIIKLKKKGKTGTCPSCEKKRRRVIEIKKRKVRDVNLNDKKCYIVFNAFRIKCNCGYKGMEKLDFVLPNEMITERFAEKIFHFCEKMSLTDAAKFAMVNWRTAKRIDKKKLQEKFKDLKNISPGRIGVDEIAHEKGHKYLTIVRDVDGGVIWVGEKRKKETLNQFFKELGKKKSKKIAVAVIDMWDPFIKSIQENTDAEIVFDKFHIAKKINEAVDKIRKKEFAKADPEERLRMKKKRFLILFRNKNLNDEKRETLRSLLDINKNLHIAYILKEQVLDIFDERNKIVAMQRLERWKENVQKTKMEEFEEVLKTMEHYWYGIENYFTHRVTNGASEGYNNKINIIKRRAYGFKDTEYFRLKILQSCS
ncbi:MAG: ISL3 family transposase [Nanoarchaeota archaeon]|nr:ISL3 family transposase [Nanoarchaeota archaeon]